MTQWSQAAKDDALTQLANGHTLANVHHTTSIPKPTLSGWAKRAGIVRERSAEKTAAATQARSEQWAELREQVANESGRTARRLLALIGRALDSGDLEVNSVHQAKDAATTMAILVDKAQVLVGDASAITGHVGLREQVAAQAEDTAPKLRAVS